MTLMIGLPCAGGIVSEKTTLGLFNLGKALVRNNIDHGLLTLTNSSLITQARSKIANFFINNTQHDYLFFLDSDIGFNPEDVLKLLAHQVPIVSGAYPMKIIPERYCVDVIQPEQRHGDLVKINGNGMGFVLIHRQVFLDIAKQYPNLKYIPSDYHSDTPHTEAEMNNSYHYFAEHQTPNSFMSEDKSFFHRAQQVGYNIWLDPTIKLNHTGYHIYQG
jgi:glycosyltransferase involved in cell wall biosynthesis